MATRTIALFLGTLIFQFLPTLPASTGYIWCGVLALLAASIAPPLRRLLRAPLWFALGFSLALAQAGAILNPPLSQHLEGRDLVVEGSVATLVQHHGQRQRFGFRVQTAQSGHTEVALPHQLRLSWYHGDTELLPGERWRFTVRLKRPHGFANPGGFDYERWLYRRRTGATGYVRHDATARRITAGPGAFPVTAWRQELDRQLIENLGASPYLGLLEALSLGIRGHISQQQWQTLNATGTTHLMAISGLHVGLVAGLVFLMVRSLWRRIPALCLRIPAIKAAAWTGIASAFCYAALAGFSIPTQRALIMATLVFFAITRQRPVRPGSTLNAALLLVLLRDPCASLDPGFWLSFLAVTTILYGVTARVSPNGWWWRWGRVQWLVALGLLPALTTLFGRLSLTSPLVNLLAVPYTGFLVVPSTVLGTLLLGVSPALGAPLLHLAAGLMQPLWYLLEWSATQAPPVSLGSATPLTLVVAMAGTALLLAPRGTPKWIGALCLLPLFRPMVDRPPVGQLWLTVLDVGQGLSTVVETATHTLVFDTGPRFSADFDAGAAVLVPFLRQRGIGRLDTLILSHGDSDHSGGAGSLLEALPVDSVVGGAGAPFADRPCRQGQHWQWDGVEFDMLNPPTAVKNESENAASCVLRVQAGSQRLLLPADIEAETEDALLSASTDLHATVLVAPHHGSNTSSTAPFIAAVDPKWVFYSVGYHNRFGFPSPTVRQRYAEHRIRARRTDHCGAISMRLGNGTGESKPHCYRYEHRRYWNLTND